MSKKSMFSISAAVVVVVVVAILIFAVMHWPMTEPVVEQPAGTALYASSTAGFSLSYPTDWTVDQNYVYQELGPGKEIAGVKFTIPASLATGTNLGADSYFSVEEIPQSQGQAQVCSAELFLDQGALAGASATTLSENGVTYSVASTTGAGAGNRYEETIYATALAKSCFAVRYFIHYGVIENYPQGSVKEFDKQDLLSRFDAIRHTLVVDIVEK